MFKWSSQMRRHFVHGRVEWLLPWYRAFESRGTKVYWSVFCLLRSISPLLKTNKFDIFFHWWLYTTSGHLVQSDLTAAIIYLLISKAGGCSKHTVFTTTASILWSFSSTHSTGSFDQTCLLLGTNKMEVKSSWWASLPHAASAGIPKRSFLLVT